MEELFRDVDEHDMMLATLSKMRELWPNSREEHDVLYQRAFLLVVDDMISEFILAGRVEVAGMDKDGRMAYRGMNVQS